MNQDIVLLLFMALLAGAALGVGVGWLLFRRAREDKASAAPARSTSEAGDGRLFEILNGVPIALAQTDREGRFVFANKAAHALLGRSDAQLTGLKFHSATWGIAQPDGRPIALDLLPTARALRGQTVRAFPHLILNAQTRKPMLVATTASPILNEMHQVTGTFAAMVSLDQLSTPETTGATQADLTQRVFDAAASALVVVDLAGRVLAVNATARRLVQGSADPVGSDFADVFLTLDERVEGRQALRAALSVAPGEAEPLLSSAGDAGTLWRILPLTTDGADDAVLLAGERNDEE